MPNIDWEPPAPRGGIMEYWDRFVGPGTTRAEEWLQAGGVLALTAVCLGFYAQAGRLAEGWLAGLIVALLAFDIAGGVVTNATRAAKRWYHRRGEGFGSHFRFTALHGVHIALVAWLFAGTPLVYFGAVYAFLLAAAAVILAVPLYLQRAVALMLCALGIVGAQIPLFTVAGLDWFLPLLFLKLLVAHIVKEAPFAVEQGGA